MAAATSIGGAGTLTLGGTLSGSFGLTKLGSGTTILTGSNSSAYTTTLISAGTLQVGNGSTTGTLGSGAVTDNAILSFNRSDSITVANGISGSGVVNQNGSGTTIFSTANTYLGATNINGGVLVVTTTGTLGGIAGDGVTTGGLTISNATLDLQRTITIGSLVMNGASPAIIRTAGTSSLIVSGTSTLAGAITTSGIQTYGNVVTLGADTSLTSTAGNIVFNSQVKSAVDKASSLSATANAGSISILGAVGGNFTGNTLTSAARLKDLTLTAPTINLNADIWTARNQVYNGAVIIGGTNTGTIGYLYDYYISITPSLPVTATPAILGNNSQYARTLISEDPLVQFNGTINDASAGTHTLLVAAVAIPANTPEIDFNDAIGGAAKLYSINAQTIQRVGGVSSNSLLGTIIIPTSINTVSQQYFRGSTISNTDNGGGRGQAPATGDSGNSSSSASTTNSSVTTSTTTQSNEEPITSPAPPPAPKPETPNKGEENIRGIFSGALMVSILNNNNFELPKIIGFTENQVKVNIGAPQPVDGALTSKEVKINDGKSKPVDGASTSKKEKINDGESQPVDRAFTGDEVNTNLGEPN